MAHDDARVGIRRRSVKRPRRIKLKRPNFRRPTFERPAFKRPTFKRPAKTSPAKAAEAKSTTATSKVAKSSQGAKKKPTKEPADDLWFRLTTRVRAAGYWIREKAQIAGRFLRKAGEWTADLWLKRSRSGKIRIGAVAGVLVLYAVIKFAPIPGVPCQISEAKECAPPDEAVALVPADALLYSHLTIDRDSTQFERAVDSFDRLADLRTILAGEIPSALPTPSGAPIDIQADVLPWADRDLSVSLLPGPGGTNLPVFIVGVGDKEGAEEFLAKVAPPGEPKADKQGDAPLSVYTNGFAAAYVDDGLVFGNESAVRAALDAGAGGVPALEDSGKGAPRDELPEARFAEAYLSQEGVQRLLVGRTGAATQLETFVDYGATSGVAVAAVAREGGVGIDLISDLDPELVKQSPSFFSGLPRFEPGLTGEASERTIGYVGAGEVGPTLAELLAPPAPEGKKKPTKGEKATAETAATGLAGSLQALATRLEQEAGVNPLRDLLPALGGQAAVVAEPTDGVPFASLIVDDVDEDAASEALANLQKPLLAALTPAGGGQVPRFEEQEVEGVTVRSVQATPTVNLSYAVFDGKLVISTDPAGIAQVRVDEGGLADSGSFERATEELPDRVSALVFLNLDELFGQVTKTDLVEDPFFANLSVLFENASSLGLAVNGDDDQIRSELFLALD